MLIKQFPKFQEVIQAEGRTARRYSGECVDRTHIRDVGKKGLQAAVGVIIEDPVFSPVALTGDHLILIPNQRMKGMGDAESTA